MDVKPFSIIFRERFKYNINLMIYKCCSKCSVIMTGDIINNHKLQRYSIRKIVLGIYILEKIYHKTNFTYFEICDYTMLKDRQKLSMIISSKGKTYRSIKIYKIPGEERPYTGARVLI